MSDKKIDQHKISFKETLNLPTTDFPIRSNTNVDDPIMVERWEREKLCDAAFEHNKGNEKFILSDGPPYANGNIHIGHAYNKILKDIVTKAQRMSGKQVPVTPGWDCHGLPIELKVTQEFPGLKPEELKKQCRIYAQKWINIQREEFKRLGVVMQWDKPYLTMNPAYEADILRAFGSCVEKGFIQKKGKTVPWCSSCQTVLATAEIEYKDRKDPSIYVLFTLPDATVKKMLPQLSTQKVSFLVWTTTPWTLPLNRAVLINPEANYQVIQVADQYVIVGAPLVDKICSILGVPNNAVAQLPAKSFEGHVVKHPFIKDLVVPVILDGSVSLSDGTACVHCAPGCGPEDYEVALKHKLEIFSPLTADGKYDVGIEPKELENVSIADGQGWVIKELQNNNNLLHKDSIRHSYPHCWRCHNGLMFRATKQWFLDLSHNNLREKALQSLEKINFLPERSKNFLKATISGRLEWCISRQRVWGVPIPALLCNDCEQAFITPALIAFVADQVAIRGIEYWDEVALEELPVKGVACSRCNGSNFKKEFDILDVWFDSGVSHFAVLHNNKELAYPADMYLEGVDQHRGWFQSSLLTSLAIEETACMRSIVTHGFTVDDKGQKMSKSIGNVTTPMQIIEKLGTDGLRLWACSIAIGADAVVSEKLLQNIAEVYRKIRNTLRFLLSNLYDFDAAKDRLPLSELLFIDKYALENLTLTNDRIRTAYEQSDFTAIFHELTDYCAKELSSFYLDVIKDRLYVEKADGKARRSAQTACWYILDTLTRLIAPVMSFTAEQVSDHYQKNKKQSIHLQNFAKLMDVWQQNSVMVPEGINWTPHQAGLLGTINTIKEQYFYHQREQLWALLFDIRSALLKAIEQQRAQGIIKHSLEARLLIKWQLQPEQQELITYLKQQLALTGQTLEQFFKELVVVSQVVFVEVTDQSFNIFDECKEIAIKVERARGVKCPRCWQWNETVHAQDLCERCALIVFQIKQ